jgi:hypothetical protein
VTHQPSRLPLLVFVRSIPRTHGTARGEPATSLLCIDKRTGRIAYQNEELPAAMIGNIELVGDAEKHTVTLTMPPAMVELTLTDEPPPDAAPKQ